jgi:hypothetical protein
MMSKYDAGECAWKLFGLPTSPTCQPRQQRIGDDNPLVTSSFLYRAEVIADIVSRFLYPMTIEGVTGGIAAYSRVFVLKKKGPGLFFHH